MRLLPRDGAAKQTAGWYQVNSHKEPSLDRLEEKKDLFLELRNCRGSKQRLVGKKADTPRNKTIDTSKTKGIDIS